MRRFLLACLLVMPLGAFIAAPVAADEAQVIPSDTKPLGVSYPEWAGRWDNWAFGTPTPVNPLVHPENCSTNLHGNVWYMPQTSFGNAAKAHCSIGRGTYLLVTPGGGGCDSSSPNGDTHDSLRALSSCAEVGFAQIYSPRVWVDGIEIGNLEPFMVRTVFRQVYPRDNIAGVRAGTYRAVGLGWFLMLRPLSVGRHTVIVRDEMDIGVAKVTAFLTVR